MTFHAIFFWKSPCVEIIKFPETDDLSSCLPGIENTIFYFCSCIAGTAELGGGGGGEGGGRMGKCPPPKRKIFLKL